MTNQCDALILGLADKLYICSRLLTAAAERLGWESSTVQELMKQLRETIEAEVRDAGIEADDQ